MALLRNQSYKERPIYFAENSSHASSSKYMEGVRTVLVTGFNLAYGFKKPVPREDWPEVLETLPPAYLVICAGGIGGLGNFLNTKSGFRKWIWLADESGNEYRVGFLPVIKFRNHLFSAGKTLVKLNAIKDKSAEATVAAQFAQIDLGDIEEIYYPVVIHINPKNREHLSWIELEPTSEQPFRIILAPEIMRGQQLQEWGIRGKRLKKAALWAVEAYEQQHNIKVDALMNLRFVARGVRNLCTIEVINLTHTQDLERETDGFRFSFGASAIGGKEAPLQHEILFNGKDLPKLESDFLDRFISTVSGSREGHSETLHINPKVMFEFGLRYLTSDMKEIYANSVNIR